MSKTAREVMIPSAVLPADEPGGGASVPAAGGVPPGRAAGTGPRPAIGVDDWVDHALVTMTELKVRRLPVVDRGRIVGVINQGDLASSIEEAETWSSLCS